MPKPASELPKGQITPDPALERRTRRVLSADYKLRILREADACQHGELGDLLRREKLYHGQLAQWRRELEESGVSGLAKSAPGPKSAMTADQKRILQLEKENQKLQKQLLIKEHCLELQKKALALLDGLEQESNRS